MEDRARPYLRLSSGSACALTALFLFAKRRPLTVPSRAMSWIRRAMLLVGLAAYLVTSLPHGALVLCIGADGHLAIEDSSASCCGEKQGCSTAESDSGGSDTVRSKSSEITCVHPC